MLMHSSVDTGLLDFSWTATAIQPSSSNDPQNGHGIELMMIVCFSLCKS